MNTIPLPNTFRFCPRCLSPLDPAKPCLVCHLISINTVLSIGRTVGIPTRKEA